MNFLNFLTSGANLFNFNLQNMTSSSVKQIHGPEKQKKIGEQEVNQGKKTQTKKDVQKQMQILNQQQFLINQYMHMNIQLLNHKLQCLEKQPKQENKVKIQNNVEEQEKKQPKRKTKHIMKCQHGDRQHYAKGLCNNCYHKYGRTKKPWKCSHSKLYAGGMCQNCYINNYNRMRRQNKQSASVSQRIKQEQFQMRLGMEVEVEPEKHMVCSMRPINVKPMQNQQQNSQNSNMLDKNE